MAAANAKDIPIASHWLLHAPKKYKDFTAPAYVFPEPDGEKHLISCYLKDLRLFSNNGSPTLDWRAAARVSLTFQDDRGNAARSMIFGAVWPWKKVNRSERLVIYAKPSYYGEFLQLDQPTIIHAGDLGRVHAQYFPLHSGEDRVSGDEVASMVKESFPLVDEASQIVLEALRSDESEFQSMFGIKIGDMLARLHFPTHLAQGLECLTVIQDVATEIVIRRAEANAIVQPNSKSVIPIDDAILKKLIASVPFPLTTDQSRSISEIVGDLRSGLPMWRMLAGDVGTGKSLVFMIPAAAATIAGARCAIITPNQLLVSQVSREMGQLFPYVPLQIIRPGGKIVDGGGLVIGTTSVLFAAQRDSAVFDLVITDEEHKFSVDQKQALAGAHTNMLKATATPIPRSIALVACDGMNLSTLEECPVHKEVNTLLIGPEKKKDLLLFVRKMVGEGQLAVVYPAVMESEKLKSIQENAVKWEGLFPGDVAVLHGQMPAKEKQAALDAMLSGSKKILVASTAIELGVTLPDLKMLIVVHPERFGVSQLHQLRGRVARHGGVGFFVMYCPEGDIPAESLERLKLVKEVNNGFALAEKDMELRGFGDLDVSGETQTGNGRIVFRGLDISIKRVVSAMLSRSKK